MKWSKEQERALHEAVLSNPGRETVAAATRAVEIKAAEGGTAEDVVIALSGVPHGPGGDDERAAVHRIAARVAVLEADNAALVQEVERLSVQRSGDQSWCRECSTRTPHVAHLREPILHAPSCMLAQPHPGAATLQELEQLRKEREELEDILSPSVLIGYARNHPPHARSKENMLRWTWATLDRAAAFFGRVRAAR